MTWTRASPRQAIPRSRKIHRRGGRSRAISGTSARRRMAARLAPSRRPAARNRGRSRLWESRCAPGRRDRRRRNSRRDRGAGAALPVGRSSRFADRTSRRGRRRRRRWRSLSNGRRGPPTPPPPDNGEAPSAARSPGTSGSPRCVRADYASRTATVAGDRRPSPNAMLVGLVPPLYPSSPARVVR